MGRFDEWVVVSLSTGDNVTVRFHEEFDPTEKIDGVRWTVREISPDRTPATSPLPESLRKLEEGWL